ncbi:MULTISPECIES: class I SAM-dependent methyltransferase [Paenibacillus]|uniref:class I SAM-dependent methyltransferase n=1 Tax=Paenibacillus TaxID=44249 RepID=UPI0022B8E21D|nr:class I SAM-dependent methyltransferase [Paenibacillus caseinilyticus]MCZ8522060.1 class I SAM-dependent methyltransferase [Paenibacillus caseinilyticus]
MSLGAYGTLCTEVYNLTKPVGKSIGGDLEFYRERLRSSRGRILEAMSGSGRLLIPLLEAGLAVEGIDASPEMLAACRQHCEERGLHVRLFEGELQELSLPYLYEAIIVPAGSFLLIEDREESVEVLRRFHDHLQPGGRLIIDLEIPEPHSLETGRTGISTFHLPDGDVITMESRIVEADLFRQTYVTYLRYDKWRGGALLSTELQRLALRWYGVEEFQIILERLGFTKITVSAGYQYGKPPARHGQALTFEAFRA